MENNLSGAEGAMQQLFDNTYPLLKTFQEINMVVPSRLKLPVELAVNSRLIEELRNPDLNLKRLENQLKSAVAVEVDLDLVTLNFLADRRLTQLLYKFKEDPENTDLLSYINRVIEVLEESPLTLEKWECQNIIFRVKEEQLEAMEARQGQDEKAALWVEEFQKLENSVNLVI